MGNREKQRHASSVRVEMSETFDRIERQLRIGILAVESESVGTCLRDGEALAMHLIDVCGEVVRVRQLCDEITHRQTKKGEQT